MQSSSKGEEQINTLGKDRYKIPQIKEQCAQKHIWGKIDWTDEY